MVYKSRNTIIKLTDNYFSMVPEAKYKPIHGKGLKTLIPKQVFKMSPIASA